MAQPLAIGDSEERTMEINDGVDKVTYPSKNKDILQCQGDSSKKPIHNTSCERVQKSDVQSETKEMKQVLLDVLEMQNVIFDEIRTLKEDNKKILHVLMEKLDLHRCECKGYTDAQVRSMECRVNGLSAVLDHVQKRCMEAEIQQHDTGNEYESISSSDSTNEQDDSVDSSWDLSDSNQNDPEEILSEIRQTEKNRKWLRLHHLSLVEQLNPQGGSLLDRLVQDNILSLSDDDKIRSQDTRKNQARELVMKLRRCSSSQFQTFHCFLKSEYPHLACLSSVDDDTGETDNVQKCIVCDVTKLVDVDDVIDYVYQKGFLDGLGFETVWKTESADERWSRLLGKLTSKSDGIQVLVEALSKKYPLMSQRLAISRQISFECSCSSKENL